MTHMKWPQFDQPFGPLRAVEPRTGRVAQLGDRIRHYLLGYGTVTGVAWDGMAGHAMPVVHLDGARYPYAYAWSLVELQDGPATL